MADYYTQAVVSTAPIKGVPDDAYHLLARLTYGDLDQLEDYLHGLDAERCAEVRQALARYGLCDDKNVWDEDVTSAACEMTVTRYGEDPEVYIHWEENLSDGAGPILQWFLSLLPEEIQYLQVDASSSCSKMRPDGFGGFCIVVTRDDVQWLHASAVADRVVRVVKGEVVDPVLILDDILDGQDWDEKSLKELCCAFIGECGLDQEFRRFLVRVAEDKEADDGETGG